MDSQKVDLFLSANGKYFDSQYLMEIRNQLLQLSDDKWILLQALPFKDPTTVFIISLFGGGFGIDRLFIGDTGAGIAKLLTLGWCGIWAIIDLFLIMGVTKDKNLEILRNILV